MQAQIYLSRGVDPSNCITVANRMTTVGWMVEVCEEFHLYRETLFFGSRPPGPLHELGAAGECYRCHALLMYAYVSTLLKPRGPVTGGATK